MIRSSSPLLAGLICVVVLFSLAGCGGGPPSPLPDDPDQLILYSLDGTKQLAGAELAEAKTKGEYLYTFPVLGKTQVTDSRQVREVLTAMRRAIGNPAQPSKCFWPRHAVRAVKGGEIVDVVVCFECKTYFTYRGSDTDGPGITPGISQDPEPLLDKILTDAGVPLAKKAHE